MISAEYLPGVENTEADRLSQLSILRSGRRVVTHSGIPATDNEAEISTRCRSIHGQNKQSTDEIHVLETRPDGMESGCTVVIWFQHL